MRTTSHPHRFTRMLVAALSLLLALSPLVAYAELGVESTEPSTPWQELQAQVDQGGTVQLEHDVYAQYADSYLNIRTQVTLDLNGFTLSRNMSAPAYDGYVIRVSQGGKLLLTDTAGGGTVTGGNNSEAAGGIYIAPGGELSISGAPTVSGNIGAGVASDVYLTTGRTVVIKHTDSEGLSRAAHVGVRTQTAPERGVPTMIGTSEGASVENLSAIFSNDPNYAVSINGANFVLVATDATVTYDANGGEGTMADQRISTSNPVTLNPNAFTRDGYLFESWNTRPTGTGTSYVDEDVVTPTGDIKLYAQWNELDYDVNWVWGPDHIASLVLDAKGYNLGYEPYHVVREATVTSTSSATCTEAGVRTYTATATYGGKEYTTTTESEQYEEVPAFGHSWGVPTYTWADDSTSCIAERVCDNDANHVEIELATMSRQVIRNATPTEKGVIRYTATFKNAAFKTQTSTVEITYAEQAELDKRSANGVITDVVIENDAPGVEVHNLGDVADSTLTDEDKEFLGGGGEIRVWLAVSPLSAQNLPLDDREVLSSYCSSMGVASGTWFDMTLYKKVGDGEATTIEEPAIAMKFTLSVPNSLITTSDKGVRTYYLARAHNDEASLVAQSDDIKLDGVSDGFSTFLLAYKDDGSKASSSASETSSNGSGTAARVAGSASSAPRLATARTGDVLLGASILGGIALAGAIVLATGVLKRRQN